MHKKITIKDLSDFYGISAGQLSDMLNGNSPIGKRSAVKIDIKTSRRWDEIMPLKPEDLLILLTDNYRRTE